MRTNPPYIIMRQFLKSSPMGYREKLEEAALLFSGNTSGLKIWLLRMLSLGGILCLINVRPSLLIWDIGMGINRGGLLARSEISFNGKMSCMSYFLLLFSSIC